MDDYCDDLNCAQAVFSGICENPNDERGRFLDGDLLRQCLDMCRPLGNGAGAGLTCGAVVAAVMCIGLLRPDDARGLCLNLLSELCQSHKCLNCPQLSACVDCGAWIDEIIERASNTVAH